MDKRLGAVAGAVLLMAPVVQGAEPKAAARPAADAESDPAYVCRNEAATGSHIKKRICVTRAAEDRRRKGDQEAYANTRMSSNRATWNKDPSPMNNPYPYTTGAHPNPSGH